MGTAEEPLDAGPCGYVPNMLEESKWFEWAGVGFGTEETYKIFKSLTVSPPYILIRFFQSQN